MSDEQGPPKKVVRRVVKKTVVRPTAPSEPEPQMRYGRPVTGTTVRPKAKAAPDSAKPTTVKPARERPKLEIGGKVKGAQKALSSRGSSAASGVVDVARSAAAGVGSRIARGGRAVRDWRLPLWDPLPASVFTGVVAGLVAVGLGLAALEMFSQVRGVSSGGGRWGSLTFVVVAFIAFAAGELLLSAFGVVQARLTSFLGVVLAIVAILGLFLGIIETGWALVLVPALGAATYALSHVLLNIAETPAEED